MSDTTKTTAADHPGDHAHLGLDDPGPDLR